ncbi:hypothetical protein T484DRAFT_1856408, partial [Baffinella frigidus]
MTNPYRHTTGVTTPLPPSLVATWRAVNCSENFERQGGAREGTPGGCNDPTPGSGGILGCEYIPAQGGGGACVEAQCAMNLTWKEVRKLEKSGLAAVGGLGKSAVTIGAKRYASWMCVRGWDAHVQRSCGAGPQDYSCWRFEEVAGKWEFVGTNRNVGTAADKELRALARNTQLRVLDAVLPTTYPPPCSPGTFASGPGRNRVCEPCPLNARSDAGSSSLADCTCPEGHHGAIGEACDPCDAGYYKNWTGLGDCRACPIYTRSDAGSSSLADCTQSLGGSLKCWGYNNYGQIGDGSTPHRNTPVMPSDNVVGLVGKVVAIAAGQAQVCATMVKREHGSLKCWGWNNGGQLGDGTSIDRHTPVDVVGLVGTIVS